MNAEVNTMVICAPAGERITAVKCTNLISLKSIADAKKEMTEWAAKK